MVKKFVIPVGLALALIVLIVLLYCYVVFPKPGDIDGDGRVSITDYTYVRLDRLELRQLSAAELQRADVNHDGLIDNGDITMIKTMVLEAQ